MIHTCWKCKTPNQHYQIWFSPNLAHGVLLKIQTLIRPNHREIHGDHVIKSIYHFTQCYALTNYSISADPPRGGGDGGGEDDGAPDGRPPNGRPPNGKRPGIILP